MSPIPSPTFGDQRPNFRRQPTLSQYVQSAQKRKNPPDRRKYCGFDMHILRATQLAALTGLFFGLLRLTFWCLDPGQDLDHLGSFLHNLALLCANGLLFCALSLQMASLCLPFLCVNPISLFLLLRFMSRLFNILSEWPLLDTILGIGPLAAAMPEEDRQLAAISIRLSLFWLLLLAITVSLLCWLQWVIFRTFLFIREMTKKQQEKEVYRNVYCMDPRKRGKLDFY